MDAEAPQAHGPDCDYDVVVRNQPEHTRCTCGAEAPQANSKTNKWYCGMCDRWFLKSGDCKQCGYRLEKGA